MRIFLLPISTRRTLLYCDKSLLPAPASPSITDRIVDKANTTWADWETASSPLQWKRRLTHYGNLAFRRIPFEEWGLKSLPPLSTADRSLRPRILFPRAAGELPDESRVAPVLRRLATERQALHKSRMALSLVGMPLAVPFGLIPIVPNVPFFYLAFRAWSHYRALYGARYLEWLLNEGSWVAEPVKDMAGYAGRRGKTEEQDGEERLLIDESSAAVIAKQYKLPGLQLEIERAVEQVAKALAEADKKKWEERRQAAASDRQKKS